MPQRLLNPCRRSSEMSYEIDADALFSDSDGGSPHGGSSFPAAVPPKRPRPAPPHRAPSLGTIRLTLPPGSSLASNTSNSTSNYSSAPGGHSAQASKSSSSYNQSTPSKSYAPTERRSYCPRPDGPSRPPFGRGRGATLPAHFTRGPAGQRDNRGQNRRFPHDASRAPHYGGQHPVGLTPEMPPSISTNVDEQLLKSAASILPASEREKILNESKSRNIEQRKRPGVARKRSEARALRSTVMEQRDKAVIMRNVQRAQSGPSNFQGLEALLQNVQKSVGGGLIRLDRPSASADKSRSANKRRRLSEKEIYAGVTMNKETREREERERLEQERRVEEERLAVIERYRTLREKEREERERLRTEWKRVETVAAGMRQSHRLERVEKSLSQDDDDHHQGDPLSSLGFRLKSIHDDELSTQLFTVEVVEI